MSIAILADSHLGGPGGNAGPFIAQLETLPAAGCRHLILLGDIFQAWVGSPQFETAEIRAVVPVLRRLRRDGMAIDYIEGNRDFFLAGSIYADCFDRVTTEIAFEHAGVRYLAVHGDGLNKGDHQYLFWRWLSKSKLSRFLILNLPSAIARHAVERTEAGLSKTNFQHKVRLPEAAIRSYGEQRLAEGHDVVLLGHFHIPRLFEVPGGEVRLLDAWFRSRRVEWVPLG